MREARSSAVPETQLARLFPQRKPICMQWFRERSLSRKGCLLLCFLLIAVSAVSLSKTFPGFPSVLPAFWR